MIWRFLIIAVITYLLGSISSGVIVSKLFLHDDLRHHGSGNSGATNAYRTMGAKLGLLVVLGDVLKGVLAALVGRWIGGADGGWIAFFFVILGHAFPVFFGFKGGKGVLTTAAVFGVIDWRILVILFIVFLAFAVTTRYVSLGSVCAAASLPIQMIFLHGASPWWYHVIAFVVAAGVIWLHRGNIKRLLTHTESKFSFKRAK